MIGSLRGEFSIRIWAIGVVALVHFVIMAWILNLPITPSVQAPLDHIEVAFAEIADAPQNPDQTEAPETNVSINRDVLPQIQGPAERSTESDSPTQVEPLEPPVLVQNTPEIGAPSAEARSPIYSGAGPVVELGDVRAVLQSLSCQRLFSHRDEVCPQLDPFDVAAASDARQTAAPAAPLLRGDYGPKNALERFASQKDRAPYIMPGMSADLFSEGMSPGAYNAQRIRDGR
ncbi:MAG: hypothetical protein AAGK93_12370, partial [Pseudomonadota bacterium]